MSAESAAPSPSQARSVVCREVREDELSSYHEFVLRNFGAHMWQARADRFAWLYGENPLSPGATADLLVALSAERVVGCIHRLRLPWTLHGEPAPVLSLHNLMVEPDYRRGAGLNLIVKCKAGWPAALYASTSAAADAIYAGLRFLSLPCVWHRKLLSRPRAGAQYAASRLGRTLASLPPSENAELREGGLRARLLVAPTEDDLAAAVALKPASPLRLDWDVATFRWRYFHPRGPRNGLVLLLDGNRLVGRAVFSLCVRHGIRTARLLELVADEEARFLPLVRASERGMRRLGAAVAMCVTTHEPALTALDTAAWNRWAEAPGTRFYLQDKASGLLPTELWGAAWDLGFDS